MHLLSLLLALAVLQWLKVPKWLLDDQWFWRWLAMLNRRLDKKSESLVVVAGIGLPLVLLGAVLGFIAHLGDWAIGLIAVALLLFSFGRSQWVTDSWKLRTAWRNNDESMALAIVHAWLPESYRPSNALPWRQQVLAGMVYHGFERLFPVLFWFLVLGPIGAVLYRLSYLVVAYPELNHANRNLAQKWLWLLEWPVLRILGLSFALTGNFLGCFHQWRICAVCTQRTTPAVLNHYIQGALHTYTEPDQLEACPVDCYSEHIDIRSLAALFGRTLLFWVCAIAVILVL